MSIPLEDSFADVIGKAQRGLGLADGDLTSRAGISREALESLKSGEFDAAAARQVAPLLGLNPQALEALGRNAYQPADASVEGLAQFNTVFGDMTVNAYLVWNPASKEAAAFDTGGDCSPMLDCIRLEGLTLKAIFLTHTHGDHIFDLDRLREQNGAPAYVSSREPVEGAETIDAGREFSLGTLRIGSRQTWGHSKGGITWVVSGLRRPVAIVGDALFAGSMGGGMVSYQDALKTDRAEIFSLPDETIVCPGHGPMTTVGEEKRHNPFFA
jgi:glyoxylase-like metal-dependent hydrolase (beta-lactamase superfamily II)